ncbi:SpaA isopeptide-forming pilin-related protein [Bifidobacterium thermacidophilum]|uniref:SpaA isopeptide-forming pilin-related protein n=1 Tax=Bifidobacterium thermacidophilum TaxID=246618 RepID=A0ABW8KMV7_9BIFI
MFSHFAHPRSIRGKGLHRTRVRSRLRTRVLVPFIVTGVIAAILATYLVAFSPAGAADASDGFDTTIKAAGSIHTSIPLKMGDNTDGESNPDTGVATYVGGNMYVGGKIGSDSAAVQSNLNGQNGITGSYAAEAEGLTLVNGRLAMRQLKNSWGGLGFRFGVVGFGSQYRPKETYSDSSGTHNASVLAVWGSDQSGVTALMTSPSVDIAAWPATSTGSTVNYGGGWIGSSYGATRDFSYTATVSGSSSIANEWGHDTDSSYASLASVSSTDGKRKAGTWSTFADASSFTVNGTDYSGYLSQVQSDSTKLVALRANGTYEVGVAPSEDFTRYKYDYFKREIYSKQSVDSYKFTFSSSSVSEKLITLTGDGTSSFQVFDLPVSALDSTGYTGIDFWLRNIPDTASVIINVVNDDGGTASNTVTFNNGWRLWWGGTEDSKITDSDVNEIAGWYARGAKTDGVGVSSTSEDETEVFATRVQQLLWNFPYTSQLTIKGGQGSGMQTVKSGSTGSEGTAKAMRTTDDPAASWMGSIYVPKGSFQSHVSTNGRVYVGGDFEMDNPATAVVSYSDGTPFTNFESGSSTSVIDMDQERHNLPWFTSDAASITFAKVDDSDATLKPGSTWAVYGSISDAENRTHSLVTVVDNGRNDTNAAAGVITVQGLTANANYYIREVAAPSGYQLNTNIYTAQTRSSGYSGENHLTGRVYTASGTQIGTSDTTDNRLHSITDSNSGSGSSYYAIGDVKTGPSVTWRKENESGDVLPGSQWKLTYTPASGTAVDYTVTDNTVAPTGVSLALNGNDVTGGSAKVKEYNNIALSATVAPDGSNQQVTWSTSDPGVAVVSDGVVTGIAAGKAVIKACAVSDTTKCGSVTVTVESTDVTSLTVTRDGSTVAKAAGALNSTVVTDATISMFNGTSVDLDASASPSSVEPVWSSNDTNVVAVSDSGLITAVANGTTMVIVQAGNKSIRFRVTVQDTDPTKTVVYFHHTENGWTGDVYLKYQANDGTWPTVGNYTLMKAVSCSNDYVATVIDLAQSGKEFLFTTSNTTDSGGWYQPSKNKNFTFTGGTAITVSGGSAKDGAPSGTSCPVAADQTLEGSDATINVGQTTTTSGTATESDTSSGSESTTSGSASGSDSDSGTTGTANTSATLDDTNATVGVFTLTNLADGTYKLTESVAPEGYKRDTKGYGFTVTNGVLSWDSGVSANTDGSLTVVNNPTQVVWRKVDGDTKQAGGTLTALPGSQWKITLLDSSGEATDTTYCIADNNQTIDTTRCTGNASTYTDTDTADGIINVQGLPAGTYKLVETVAPVLYQLPDSSDTWYTFTISPDGAASAITDASGSTTMLADASGTSMNTIGDIRQTGSATWKKTDITGHNLRGSSWKVTFCPDSSPDSCQNVTITDWAPTDGSTTNTACSTTWACDVDPAAGVFKLDNLPWGTYTLQEDTAPDGYIADKTSRTFTTVRAKSTSAIDATLLTKDVGSIENEISITSLPLTGGEWTPRIVAIIGISVLAVAAVSYGIARRRRRG